MKLTKVTTLLVFGVVLALASTGCRKHPYGVTPLPGSTMGSPKDLGPGSALGSDTNNAVASQTESGIPANPPGSHENWAEDRNQFAANTVHFDFDSSQVKSSEQGNVSAVADYLKSHEAQAVKIEGHCDERGTDEYNQSLGERRASALREELVKLGVAASRVDTISYGFHRPVDTEHNAAAWAKNRRGEFVLLSPPSAAASTQ